MPWSNLYETAPTVVCGGKITYATKLLAQNQILNYFQAGKSASAVMQDGQQHSANILMKQTAGTTFKETAMKSSQLASNSRFSFSWRDLARNLYMHDELAVANGELKKQATKQEGTNRRTSKPKLWCPLCHQERDGECPIHGATRAFVKPVDPEQEGMKLTHAIKSFPEEVQLCRSSIPGLGYGVCARRSIPIGTWIGPYEGLRIDPGYVTPAMDTSYMWEIYKDGKLFCFIDASDENTSSWMRFIRCARNKEEQNLFAFQYLGNIYYRAYREIPPGNELLVWYDDKYPQYMGIPADIYDLSIMNARTPNGGQQENKKPTSPSDGRPPSHHAPPQLSPRFSNNTMGSSNVTAMNGSAVKMGPQPVAFISTRNSAFAPPTSRGSEVDHNAMVPNTMSQNAIGSYQGGLLTTYDGMSGMRLPNPIPSPQFSQRPENTRFPFPSPVSRDYAVCSTASSTHSYPVHSHQSRENARRMPLQAPPPLNSVAMNGKCNRDSSSLSPSHKSPTHRSPIKSPKNDSFKTEMKDEHKSEEEVEGTFDPNEFGMWRCGQCDKSFAQRILLQVHVCPPNKPFQCGHCSETFLHSEDLRGHVVNHINDKPFRCGYCSRSFAGATTLNNHIRTHTGEKPFTCDKCGRTFTQASQLQRHERNPGECARLVSRPY